MNVLQVGPLLHSFTWHETHHLDTLFQRPKRLLTCHFEMSSWRMIPTNSRTGAWRKSTVHSNLPHTGTSTLCSCSSWRCVHPPCDALLGSLNNSTQKGATRDKKRLEPERLRLQQCPSSEKVQFMPALSKSNLTHFLGAFCVSVLMNNFVALRIDLEASFPGDPTHYRQQLAACTRDCAVFFLGPECLTTSDSNLHNLLGMNWKRKHTRNKKASKST